MTNGSPATIFSRFSAIDRRWIFLMIGLGTLLPIIFLIGFKVSITATVRSIFDAVEKLGPDDVVMLSFDYGPTTGPENDPMASAVLRHCLSRGIKVVALALYPLGGGAVAERQVNLVGREYPNLRLGVDYVNLGYKDGGQAAMKAMGDNIHTVFPQDTYGTPIGQIPLMQRVHNYGDVDLVVSIATGIIGEYWANLVNAQFKVPVAVGCTAVSAPKYYAYLGTGQMIGLLGGLKGASEYERLLIDAYPTIQPIYDDPMMVSAIKGMDVQTVDHSVVILFILFGNIAFFATRARTRRG